MSEGESEFGRLMKPEVWGGDSEDARLAIYRVTDTAHICLAWWREQGGGLKPSAADVLMMVQMILEDERRRREG